MNTKLATTQIRLNEWAAVIKDCKSSGLKVDEYCQQHNLSRDAYYYWLRKVKAAALQQAGFVELTAPESGSCSSGRVASTSFTAQMTIKAGNLELGVSNETPSELLSRVLEVIQRAQ